MSATLSIVTLGGLALRLDDTAVTGLASRKAEALLVYLACEPRPHARSVLATLLWDDRPQQRALGNLSVLLSSLRKQLAPFLHINRQTVAINPASTFQLDVTQFLQHVTAVAPQQTLTRTHAAQLTQAVALYQGSFLAGFHILRAGGFEEWVFMEQERLQQTALLALSRLVEFHKSRQQYSQGIEHARRLVQYDPLREQSQGQLLRLLALDGQRNAALEQYHVCRQVLLDELGVEPAAQTTALYRQIKEGHFTQHDKAPVIGPISRVAQMLPNPGTTFVGREDELRLITRRLDDPDCRLLTVTGPGGIGKTRLGLQAAQQRAGDFLHGVCFVSLAALESAAFWLKR